MNQIGVAALPFLVNWVDCDPPQWKRQLSVWASRARLPFADRPLYSISYHHELAIRTRYAFLVLGDKAIPAFDDLWRLANETNKPFTAFAAFTALQALGTNAVPPLLAFAANTNHPLHIQAQFIAGEIVRNHAPAIATKALAP
jgi:hypothetical protein